MAFIAIGTGLATVLGASAGTAGLIGAGAGILGGALTSKKASNNSSAAAAQAAQSTPVDINALNTQAVNSAQSNAAAGNALEQQYNPYINALRQSSAANLNQYLTPSASQQGLYGGLLNGFNQAASGPAAASPLFTNAANAAQQQLNLGGTLDQETQNQIMRAGAAKSGQLAGPGGGLGLGRDISARDLGLTSLQLQNQRIQNAASIGSTQQNYGLSALQQQYQSMYGLGGLANQMGQQQYGNAMGLAQFTQGIQQPQVGLSGNNIASIATGNSNMANNANQQSAAINAQSAQGQAGFGGQMLGYGLSGLSKYYAPTSTYAPTTGLTYQNGTTPIGSTYQDLQSPFYIPPGS